MTDFSRFLIATDLDGTFLGRRSGLVERNIEAVERFKAGGGLFTAATGRIHHDLLGLIPSAPSLFNAPAIMGNGSYLYDLTSGESYAEHFLDPDMTLEFVHFVQELDPEVGVRLSMSEGFITDADRLTPLILRDMNHPGRRDTARALPLSAWPVHDPSVKLYKMVVRGTPEALARIRPTVEAHFGDVFTYTSSSPDFYEIQTGGCDKGRGLRALTDICAAHVGHPLTSVAAGNHENDLPLITAADLSGCPSDALPAIMPYCTYILDPYADGCIADLIDRLEDLCPNC